MTRPVILSIAAILLAACSAFAGGCFWLYIVINAASWMVAIMAARSGRKGKTYERQHICEHV